MHQGQTGKESHHNHGSDNGHGRCRGSESGLDNRMDMRNGFCNRVGVEASQRDGKKKNQWHGQYWLKPGAYRSSGNKMWNQSFKRVIKGCLGSSVG